VCGLNHSFLTGFLTGLNAPTVRAVLQPRVGECCVELRSATADDRSATDIPASQLPS
jgi:hypothetical protein